MAVAETPGVAGSRGAAVPALPRRHWFLVLFGLPFAGGGIAILVFALLPLLTGAWRAQSWEQGEARLTSAGLDVSRDDDSTTYRARATYDYQYRGREYSGERVAIGGGRDNIGSFQENLGRRLTRAYQAGEPVPVWINPENPTEAVLNRDFRWGLTAFYLGMGLVFGAVGGSLVWFALRPRRPTAVADAAGKPWLLRPEWAGPEIGSRAGTGLKVTWLFAVVWNGFAVPVGILSALEFLDGNRPAALGLLFPLAGAGLLAWAIRQTLAWRRFGNTAITMDPYPGAIGGQVGGTVDVRVPYDPQLRFRTSLTCLYSHMTGSGKNRRRSERVVWQTEGVAFAVPRLEHTRLEILFEVDSGLPESDLRDESSYHLWRLHIEADLPGVDFDRAFEIPVFPTGASARELRRLSTEHRAAAEERRRSIDHVLDIRQVPGGIELYFPAFRHPWGKVFGFLFGSAFFGFGLLVSDAPIVMRLIFGAVGGGIALASLYNLLVSLRVRIDHTQLEIRRRLLGLPAGGASVPRAEISGLTLKQSYSSSRGGKQTVYFKLQALASGGRALKIGHNLPGQETAREALVALSEVTGIPLDETVQGNLLA